MSARLLELGDNPPELSNTPHEVTLEAWETDASAREHAEMTRYEAALQLELDEQTRMLLNEILEVEHHHAASLGGKWTKA